MKKVVVGVTEKIDLIKKEFVLSLLATVKECFDNDIELYFDFTSEETTEYMNKNLICNRVLSSEKIDGVVFLNPNLEWSPKTLVDLISHGEDIMCGVYPQDNINEEKYMVSLKENYDENKSYVEATITQDGALYVSREALVKISNNAKYYGEKEFYFFFMPEIVDGTYTIANDTFCKLAIDSGITLNLNPKLQFINIGKIPFSGDFLKVISNKWISDTSSEEFIVKDPVV